MERRLFDDLVVSRRGARAARAGGMPASFAIHAAGIAALVAAAAIAPVELPAPPAPRITEVPVLVDPRPPAGGRRAAAVPERRPERRAAPADQAPLVDPVAPPQPDPDPFDEPIGDACPECLPSDEPPGPTVGDPGLPDTPAGRSSGAGPGPVRVGGRIEAPRKLRHVDPVYPELARRAGVTGIVILECVIDREGGVDRVAVLRGHPLLDAAAVDAVRRWRYRPTLLNGVPVEVVMTVTVRFAAAR
jgi:protein TonB